ncbi:MAG TPA: GNAT family N-acetyltransferase, partial [Thermoprotei archaeon]|nr:GNAT family N-acetyltransferase [Thermoprotei archaeon]
MRRHELMIRQLKAKDLPSVLSVAASSFKEEARRPEVIGPGFIDDITRFPSLQIGAFDGGLMVGFAIGELAEDWGVLDWIAVTPSHQRMGIGSELLKQFERRISLSGRQRVRLGTPFALDFYVKMGYTCVGTQRVLQKTVVGNDEPFDNAFSMTLNDLVDMLEDFELDSIKCFFSSSCVAVGRRDVGAVLATENRWSKDEIDVVFSKYEGVESHFLLLSQLEAKARQRGAYVITEKFDEAEVGLALKKGWEESRSPLAWTTYYMEKRLRARFRAIAMTAEDAANVDSAKKKPLKP